jgi:acyl carrier protein
MDHTEISQRIHAFILDKLLEGEEPVNLTENTPLVSGGVIDSVNALRVGLFLEKAFSIKIAPEELADPENMETIAGITRLVVSKI